MTGSQKITLGEMRSSGVRGILIYCADYKCSHSMAVNADPWPDDVRLSDHLHGVWPARCGCAERRPVSNLLQAAATTPTDRG
jgi:hypothetical protein